VLALDPKRTGTSAANRGDRLSYGAGCAGLGLTGTLPTAGGSVTLTTTGISPNAIAAVLALGITQIQIPIGPGCDLLHDLAFPTLALSLANPTITFPIPCNATFFGATVLAQSVVIDPTVPGSIGTSNGVSLTVGND
jgi:hypothetical protein